MLNGSFAENDSPCCIATSDMRLRRLVAATVWRYQRTAPTSAAITKMTTKAMTDTVCPGPTGQRRTPHPAWDSVVGGLDGPPTVVHDEHVSSATVEHDLDAGAPRPASIVPPSFVRRPRTSPGHHPIGADPCGRGRDGAAPVDGHRSVAIVDDVDVTRVFVDDGRGWQRQLPRPGRP